MLDYFAHAGHGIDRRLAISLVFKTGFDGGDDHPAGAVEQVLHQLSIARLKNVQR